VQTDNLGQMTPQGMSPLVARERPVPVGRRGSSKLNPDGSEVETEGAESPVAE